MVEDHIITVEAVHPLHYIEWQCTVSFVSKHSHILSIIWTHIHTGKLVSRDRDSFPSSMPVARQLQPCAGLSRPSGSVLLAPSWHLPTSSSPANIKYVLCQAPGRVLHTERCLSCIAAQFLLIILSYTWGWILTMTWLWQHQCTMQLFRKALCGNRKNILTLKLIRLEAR